VVLVLWKTLITRYGGRVTEALDASSLAKITDGYTPGHMVQAIQHILTERRVQQVCNERKQRIAYIFLHYRLLFVPQRVFFLLCKGKCGIRIEPNFFNFFSARFRQR